MKQVTLFIVALLFTFTSMAQTKEVKKNTDGTISFVKPDKTISSDLTNEISFLSSLFNNSIKADIKLQRSFTDADGNTHDHFDFYYQGFRISGAGYAIHSNNKKIEFANGTLPLIKERIKPIFRVPVADAEKKASANFNVQQKSTISNPVFTAFKETVWLYKDGMLKLAHEINTGSSKNNILQIETIDATTGELLQTESTICTTDADKKKSPPPYVLGTAATLYSGAENITTDTWSGQFRLREVTTANSVTITTRNANHDWDASVIVGSATDFTDNDNNWQATEHGNDRYATDVHWATENVIEYWRTQQNRNSINGSGMAANGYVHANDPFTTAHGLMDNAYWSSTYNAMFYGDGNIFFGPVVSFDVIAHEFGHGINQYTGYVHGTGIPGALNEGLSDIWGATIEHWAAPAKQAWIIGEELQFGGLRNIQNPLATNNPDCFGGDNWINTVGCTPTMFNDYCGVHQNSTVLSHWYYLLVTGGTGWNNGHTSHAPTGQGYEWIVNPLGWDVASRIAYATEQFLPQTADYTQARNTSIARTVHDYGAGSCEEEAVTNAWYAVGVGAAFSNVSITGNSGICRNSTQTYTVPICNSASNVTWDISPNDGEITLVPNGTSVDVTTSNNADRSYTLIATLPVTNVVIQKTITVQGTHVSGFYSTGGSTTAFTLHENDDDINTVQPYATYVNITSSDITSATWSVVWGTPNYWYWVPLQKQLAINLPDDEFVIFRMNAQTSCGTLQMDFSFQSSIFAPYLMSPNPASSTVTIAVDEQKLARQSVSKSDKQDIREVTIIDRMGNIVLKQQFGINTRQAKLNVANLLPGVYSIHLSNGKNQQTLKFVKL